MSASGVGHPEMVQVSNESVAYIVSNEQQWEAALAELKSAMGEMNAVGLDVENLATSESQPRENRSACEDVPNDFRRVRNISLGRVPLLQLGAPGLAVLVRLCYFEKPPLSLVEFLENKDIVKIGVDVLEDAQRLKAQWHLRVVSCMDLRLACLECRHFCQVFPFYSFNLKSIGAFLGQDIKDGNRDWKLACSNWAAVKLDYNQIAYAAKDAIAAVGSYAALLTRHLPGSKCKFSPREAQFWEYHWQRRFKKYVNVPFNQKKLSKYQKQEEENNPRQSFSEMKPKQYKKMEEAMHKSDSDLDVDFQELKNKRFSRMQPMEWVGFYACGEESEDFSESLSRSETADDRESHSEAGLLEEMSETAGYFSLSDSALRMEEKTTEEQSEEEAGEKTGETESESEPVEEETGPIEEPKESESDRRDEVLEMETDPSSAMDLDEQGREESESVGMAESASLSADKLEVLEGCLESVLEASGALDKTGDGAELEIGDLGENDSSSSYEKQSSVADSYYTERIDSVGEENRPPLMVEKELLDWCFEADVKLITLTASSAVGGIKQRYRIKMEVISKSEE